MYNILMMLTDRTACGHYRAILPWVNCREDLRKEGIQLDLSENLNTSDHYDAYIFHRLLNPEFFPILWDLKFNAGKKIIWDIDDNLFKIPSWSPAKEMMGRTAPQTLMTCLEWADLISVTTGRFRDQLSAYKEWEGKIRVNQNLVDMREWSFPEKSENDGPVKIVWAGSLTHHGDLEIIAPACLEIIKEYKDEIQFIFMGMMPEKLRANKNPEFHELLRRNVVMFNGVDINYYQSCMNFINPDIALLPLEDNEFNDAKSNIKYLEMTLSGAVCIGSNVGPYDDTINDAIDGLKSENTMEDWYINISNLVRFKSLRESLYYEAKKKVIKSYTWDSPRKVEWLETFREIAETPVAKSP